MIATENDITELRSNWNLLKEKSPKMRIRDAAEELGVSELELTSLSCLDGTAVNLKLDFEPMMRQIETFGYVMGLTRNNSVVHETKGVYSNFSAPSKFISLFVNPDIDLRIFQSVWKYALAVDVPSRGKVLKSIQFFSSWGEAVHKIYLNNKSDLNRYETFVDRFKHEFQGALHPEQKEPEKEQRVDVDSTAIEKFQQEWKALKDTHDFFGMLRKYSLTRLNALENAPSTSMEIFGKYALRVPKEALTEIIETASKAKVPTMTFVGNRGMIQIFTGMHTNIVRMENWFNVMDKEFNLHLNLDDVDQVWLVFKPTTEGIVSSVEVFNKDEQMLLQLFGKRKPGIPEDPNWRGVVNRWI